MTPDDLADLHARAFPLGAWSARAFADQLAAPGSFLITRPHGFVLGQIAVDESELLTICTDPDHRRQGIARALLSAFCETAINKGATRAFLEVAEGNHPARALYDSAGWREAGRRRGYYKRQGQAPEDAILMDLPLTAAAER